MTGALLADVLTEYIEARRAESTAPVLVALDGRSGAGKSTLAATIGGRTGALVIDGDDFYSGGTDTYWDGLDARQKVERVIDWRHQRAVLESLRQGRTATWHPYDWDADDGRLAATALSGGPAGIVILDGAYSARPELADLLTLRVLLDVPRDVRRRRLLEREGARYRAEWEARWTEAENLHFTTMMPREAFDLTLTDR
jgi:uridine kinase